MKKIQMLVLLITAAISAAYSITNVSTDNNVKRSSQVSNECLLFSRPADCEEVRLNGKRTSGVYTIWPRNRKMSCKSIQVYCDMSTDGGGWTVLQRRRNYTKAMDNFNKTWEIYKKGFGHLDQDFWIGNDVMYVLTNQGSYSVRFDMRLFNGTSAYAVYDQFWIEDEDKKYKLNIAGYSGNAGDSMSYHNANAFSTWDKNNDQYNNGVKYGGGWWFGYSFEVNFNGIYRGVEFKDYRMGIHWEKFSGYYQSLEFTEIKIRPRFFN